MSHQCSCTGTIHLGSRPHSLECMLLLAALLMEYSTMQLAPMIILVICHMTPKSSTAPALIAISVSAVGVTVLVYISAELSHAPQLLRMQ